MYVIGGRDAPTGSKYYPLADGDTISLQSMSVADSNAVGSGFDASTMGLAGAAGGEWLNRTANHPCVIIFGGKKQLVNGTTSAVISTALTNNLLVYDLFEGQIRALFNASSECMDASLLSCHRTDLGR